VAEKTCCKMDDADGKSLHQVLDFGGEAKYDDHVNKMTLGVGKDEFETLHLSCVERLRNFKNR